MKRRNFMTRGLPGIGGVLALSQYQCRDSKKIPTGISKKPAPITRTLGKTGLKIPIVSLGSMDVTSEALVRRAFDAGITHISTSKVYGRGRVEKFVGRVIKSARREDIILATTVNPHPHNWKTGLYSPKTDVARFERDFESSLKSMDVDYVDIFYLPFAAKKESVMFEPLMKALERIKKSGKARFVGITTHSYVTEAVRAAADSDFYDVVMLSYNFQIRDIEERKQAVGYAADKGMGIVAMKTITGESWFYTNKNTPASNPKAALKWVLQNPNIHTTVPGITSFDQLETDLSVMADLTLTREEKKYLELARLNHKQSLYCQGCGQCLKQCREAPDIPTLMRCYMYVYGYRDLAVAVRNLESIKDNSIACSDCTSCTVKCPGGFDIRERVLDIIRLREFPSEYFT